MKKLIVKWNIIDRYEIEKLMKLAEMTDRNYRKELLLEIKDKIIFTESEELMDVKNRRE